MSPPSPITDDFTNDAEFIEPWLSYRQLKRQRCEIPSSSTSNRYQQPQMTEEVYLALLLINLSKSEKLSHKCNICGEAFQSHQALGVHKTTHQIKPPTADANTNNSTASESRVLPHFGKIFECYTCRKVYPNGRALACHERTHYSKRGRGFGTSKSVRYNGSVSFTASEEQQNLPALLSELSLTKDPVTVEEIQNPLSRSSTEKISP